MLVLGPIAFAAPWVLAAVVALPVLWWLLRLTPPVPRLVRFPAVRLLRDLYAHEETPAHTPWWLLLLRLAIAGLVILALAGPVLHPDAELPGRGPLLLVIDDGWSAARDWSARVQVADGLLTRAERQDRAVVIAATAPEAKPGAPVTEGVQPGSLERSLVLGPMRAADARRVIQRLEPRPWPEDRAAALAALRDVKDLAPGAGVAAFWLSNGLEDAGASALGRYLAGLGGGLQVMVSPLLPELLLPPVTEGAALAARLVRARPGAEQAVAVRLWAGDGRLLALETARFAPGATTATARFGAPLDVRNQATRLDLEGQGTAGGVVLLDDRWRLRPVGLVASRSAGEIQPLLSDLYYLDRALAPTSEVRRGSLEALLRAGDLSVVILGDVGALEADEIKMLGDWVGRGGLLVRFAGAQLARTPDRLVPVRLRVGNRVLGGSLSWTKPAHLAPFDAASPFAGLSVPSDVTVERQVLAEPDPDLAEHTWARLADGTPLVTAERRGQGSIVLIHTTANPEWSNLALSGLFVDMLRRLVALSTGVSGEGGTEALAPLASLDGWGRLGEPPATAQALGARGLSQARVEPVHPPGFYGSSENRRALNLTAGLDRLQPLSPPPAGASMAGYDRSGEWDLKPGLLGLAFGLLLVDMVVALALRGLMPVSAAGAWRKRVGLALLASLVGTSPARAGAGDGDLAMQASAKTWLAYVVTGDAVQDRLSRAGLEGLMPVILRRTAVDLGGVAAVHLENDELAFFPLLYWPVSATEPALTGEGRRRVNEYLHHGGTILFDTRDDRAGSVNANALRTVTQGLDIPPLTPLPSNHVLTKSFYLLRDFPGRIAGGQIWVEAREDRRLDGVSPVIVGGNDWAGAWAMDVQGQPMFAAVPGGERQREMAYRFGINVLMYALTGNYKADQVHVPAILQRIGQ